MKNSNGMNAQRKILSFFSLSLFFLPFLVSAQATLFLSPPSGSYEVGDSFSVLVNLNSGGEAINASTGQINFDNTKLQVVSLGYSQSIFSLWTDNPSFSNPAGTINFSGGVPSPGFIGASGGVLRITFRVKAPGQAPVNFLSGSVLANDGQGTNIADGLRGALYSLVVGETTPVKPVETKPEVVPDVQSERPIEVPIITEWPKELSANSTLTIKGLGIPLTKIFVILQKGSDEPVKEYTFSGPDGKFIFTYTKKAEAGYYRVWARNVTDSGNESGLSDPVTIEVTASTFIRVGGLVLDYVTIIITLLSLLLFIFFLALFLWLIYRRKKKSVGDEISEAEHVLHHSFDTLKDGLAQYVTYIVNAKTPAGIKRREQKTKLELKEELEDIEGKIKKEIEDIR